MSERARKEQTMKEFKKSDLKNRMVVEYRNGERKLVVDDLLMDRHESDMLTVYNDDLTFKDYYCNEYDITRVYPEANTFEQMLTVEQKHEPIWQRSEVKEVTMAEVEEKFGCKVKIVKG